jgi:hypothetical protein
VVMAVGWCGDGGGGGVVMAVELCGDGGGVGLVMAAWVVCGSQVK